MRQRATRVVAQTMHAALAVGAAITWTDHPRNSTSSHRPNVSQYYKVLDPRSAPGSRDLAKNAESSSWLWRTLIKFGSASFTLMPQPHYTFLEAVPEQPHQTASTTTRTPRRKRVRTHNKEPIKHYDFVIVGYGTAGMNALTELRKACPSASIALVDPLQNLTQLTNDSKLDFFAQRATRLDPRQRLVYLDHSSDGEEDEERSTISIQYKCALLLASGARGAPPPIYLMDEASQAHILELRSTVIPFEDQLRPVLTMDQVRQTVLQKAAAGAKVGILGSGCEAIDLAVAVSSVGKKSNRPTLVFGYASPLCHLLPSYLSSAVTKRLKAKRIHVQDRTLVRYVSHDRPGKHDGDGDSLNGSSCYRQKMQLHTAKLYDLLDSSQTDIDLLVLAPDTSGASGSAALATDEVPEHLLDSANGRPWYQTWSNLSRTSADAAVDDEPSLIACFKDDGRVVVNVELSVCTGVYAAGSVAKYPNEITGHAHVAGFGVEDGAAAGRIAGLNMARHYREAGTDGSGSLFRFVGGDDFCLSSTSKEVRTKCLLPVWRSDLRPSCNKRGCSTTTLADIGISALCVGNCDSETYSTHGIWWTNQSAQRRMFGLLEDTMEDSTAGQDDVDRLRRRTMQRRRQIKKSLKPVYGIGVVFYLNRNGKIQGVMTWGLPLPHESNTTLVEHMKSIILTNGGFHDLESEQDHVLMSHFLDHESRRMVAMAFSGACDNSYSSGGGGRGSSRDDSAIKYQLDGVDLENFPRPLHRFTEVRPPSHRSLNILKRKDDHGQGILGQDLFARYQESVTDRPVPLPPTNLVGYAAQSAQNLHEWNMFEHKFKQWDENESRARPAKEEPLWIRKGDDMQKVAYRDTLMNAYHNARWSTSRRQTGHRK